MFSHNIPVQYGRLEIQLTTVTNGNCFLTDFLIENTGTTLYLLNMGSLLQPSFYQEIATICLIYIVAMK